uniref:Aspartate dehydrogenase domain-containing protein n=1 Tax=Chelonoidis abingdonii TaxID=106734 RepID=A0A8C0HBG9_CHEAB
MGSARVNVPPPVAVSCPCSEVDLVVEVAHPCVVQDHGASFLSGADFMVGSPTALADQATEMRLREAARHGGHTLYVPRGALWGSEDIQRMDDRGVLQGLKVTMIKHPDSFRLEGALRERLGAVRAVLYEGPVRGLCPLAPNNVNTMAAACMAAPSLGFDGVQGCLIADPGLVHPHSSLLPASSHPCTPLSLLPPLPAPLPVPCSLHPPVPCFLQSLHPSQFPAPCTRIPAPCIPQFHAPSSPCTPPSSLLPTSLLSAPR